LECDADVWADMNVLPLGLNRFDWESDWSKVGDKSLPDLEGIYFDPNLEEPCNELRTTSDNQEYACGDYPPCFSNPLPPKYVNYPPGP